MLLLSLFFAALRFLSVSNLSSSSSSSSSLPTPPLKADTAALTALTSSAAAVSPFSAFSRRASCARRLIFLSVAWTRSSLARATRAGSSSTELVLPCVCRRSSSVVAQLGRRVRVSVRVSVRRSSSDVAQLGRVKESALMWQCWLFLACMQPCRALPVDEVCEE